MELSDIEALVRKAIGTQYAISPWPDGTQGFKYPNKDSKSRPVAFIKGKGLNNVHAQVMHVYRDADVLIQTYGRALDSKYFVEQKTFKVNGYVMTLRSFVNLLSEVDGLSRVPFRTVRGYLSGVLEALDFLHKEGLFHGDLRPENVAIGTDNSVRLVDYAVRVPITSLPFDRKRYVAPELRDGSRRGSASGDMYSFGQLATELLRPFRGDPKNPEGAKLERQLSWLADYCAVAAPNDRPSALSVKRALIDVPPRHDPELANILLDAYSTIKKEGAAPTSVSKRFRLNSHPSNVAALKKDVDAHPETGFALKCVDTAQRLARWLAIDNFVIFPHTKRHAGIRRVAKMDKRQLEDHIDSKWLNSIHRSHFGFGIDRDHEVRIRDLVLTPAQIERDRVYLNHVRTINLARNTLIRANEFYHTAEVAEMISGSDLELTDTEIITMRQWGTLLAVPDHDRWLYPAFQFNPRTAMPSPLIRVVDELLKGSRETSEDEWSVLSFWNQPRLSLGGQAFKDILWRSKAEVLIRRDVDSRRKS